MSQLRIARSKTLGDICSKNISGLIAPLGYSTSAIFSKANSVTETVDDE
jgi:predicted xylose isomerase-like sugar epimerase